MNKEEYFIYAIKHDLLSKIKFYYAILTIPDQDNFKNEFFKYDSNTLYALIDNKEVIITDYIPDNPLFTIHEIIKIPKDTIPLIKKDLTTTIGIFIANYVLIYKPFKTKISYNNGPLNIGKLESFIGNLLMNEDITVEEYKTFVDCAVFLEQLSDIVTVSATATSIVPPPGLKEYKTKLRNEFDKKYGKLWVKDQIKIAEYDAKLKQYLKDYLKDDKAYGKLMSGKVLNNSWTKRFLTFGAEDGFDETGSNVQQVDGSLMDDWPEDKEKLAAMFNSSRSGSYHRGHETQKGGSVAKDILRATSFLTIKGDCKVTYGEFYNVTEDIYHILVGRYLIVNKKSILIKTLEDAKKYIGKRVEIRSPKYCKAKGNSICTKCVGEYISLNPDGINLAVTNISATILKSALKRIHNSTITAIPVNIQDVIM